MTRRYGDTIEVRRRDDVPAEFLWNGRFHVVREVLAHWVEAGAWWHGAAAVALHGSDQHGGDQHGGDQHDGDQHGGDQHCADPAGGSLAVDDAEREMWRVEATAGRSTGTGVYDLGFDWGTGSWTLARTLD